MMESPNCGIVPAVVSAWSSGPANMPGPAAASAAWPTANRAYYYPVYLPHPCTAVKVWWWNGATAAGNVDCGIYDANLTRLVSVYTSNGSALVAQAGTSVLQEFDITDTLIPSGVAFLGLMLSDATGTIFRANTNGNSLRVQSWRREDTAGNLPTTATFADATTAHAPVFGFSLRTLVA